jgi:hypothetical protein
LDNLVPVLTAGRAGMVLTNTGCLPSTSLTLPQRGLVIVYMMFQAWPGNSIAREA